MSGAVASRSSTSRPAPRQTTAIIVVSMCLVFLYGILWEVLSYRKPNFDELLFLDVAGGVLRTGFPMRTTANGDIPFYDHTPLYNYLLAIPVAASRLIGNFELVLSRGVTTAFGLGTVVMVFLVGRQVRGTAAGAIAAWLVAVNPYFVHFSWFIHMEVPMSFFMVLGLYLVLSERFLLAGLALAVAVLLKEIALALWFVLAVYVLVDRGAKRALAVGLPALIAFFGWLGIAGAVNASQLQTVMARWFSSVGGTSTWDERFQIPLRKWILTVTVDVIGNSLGGALIVATVAAVVRRQRIPRFTWVPIAYCLIAVGTTFLIHLKEDRWLTAVIPMGALVVGTVVDWPAVGRALARLDRARLTAPTS